MNIFFLGYSVTRGAGGIENYTWTILNHLKEQGHKITVCTIIDPSFDFDNIHLTNRNKIDQYLFNFRLARELRKKGRTFDTFLCGHIYLFHIMEKLASRYNKSYSLFAYGIDCWGGRFQKRLPKMKHLDKVISISSFTSEQILEQGFVGELVYLPPVLDAARYPARRSTKTKQHGEKIIFLTVGRLASDERYKGHDKVIKALRLLINSGITNIEYWIVGNGNDLIRLKIEVDKEGLNQYVRFHGSVSEASLDAIYRNADVFIMPSNVSLDSEKPEGEGFGIVFIEASINEMAIIGPDIGGSTDIIDDGITGLTCKPNDPSDIAKKMMCFINNPDFRMQCGAQGRLKVMEKFSTKSLPGYLNPLLSSIK